MLAEQSCRKFKVAKAEESRKYELGLIAAILVQLSVYFCAQTNVRLSTIPMLGMLAMILAHSASAIERWRRPGMFGSTVVASIFSCIVLTASNNDVLHWSWDIYANLGFDVGTEIDIRASTVNTFFLFTLVSYITHFMLLSRHVLVVTLLGIAPYIIVLGTMRTVHRKDYYDAYMFHMMYVEFIPLVIGHAFTVLVKVSAEHSSRQLFELLEDKHQDLIIARVKRCEAEYEMEHMRHHSRAASPPTGHSSTRGSERLCQRSAELRDILDTAAALGKSEHWCIYWADIQMQPEHVLGTGHFGVVVAASLHGTPIAVKIAHDARAVSSRIPQLTNELRIMRRLRHPNIVQFHGACIDVAGGNLGIVLEFVQGPCLTKFITTPCKTATTVGRQSVILGVCSAVRYLHALTPIVLHGDLKPSNIIVQHSTYEQQALAHVKLLDFGLSRVLSGHVRPLGGTARWMAPEVLWKELCSPATSADVFSIGRLIHFIATSEYPFKGMTRDDILQALERETPEPVQWRDEAVLPEDGRQLCEECLRMDSAKRPDMQEVHSRLQLGLLSACRVPALPLASDHSVRHLTENVTQSLPDSVDKVAVTLGLYARALRIVNCTQGWLSFVGRITGIEDTCGNTDANILIQYLREHSDTVSAEAGGGPDVPAVRVRVLAEDGRAYDTSMRVEVLDRGRAARSDPACVAKIELRHQYLESIYRRLSISI